MSYETEFLEKFAYASIGGQFAAFPLIEIKLKTRVDEDLLLCGTEKAMDVHRMFSCRLVRKDEILVWEDSVEPPVIKDIAPGQRFTYGRELNNGYPWIVYYHDRSIYFHCLFAETGVSGAFMFLKTLLWYYHNFRVPVLRDDRNVYTLDNMPDEDFMFCPEKLQTFTEDENKPEDRYMSGAITYIKKDLFISTQTRTRQYLITLDQGQVERAALKNGVGTTEILGYGLMRAFVPFLFDLEGAVTMTVLQDMRLHFGSSTTRNLDRMDSVFESLDDMRGKDPATVQQNIKKQRGDNDSCESINRYLKSGCKLNQMAKENSGTAKKMSSRFTGILDDGLAHVFYSMTPVMMPEDMREKIEEITIYGPCSSNYSGKNFKVFNAVGIIMDGKIKLTISHRLKDNIYADNFLEALDMMGIDHEMECLEYPGQPEYLPPKEKKTKKASGKILPWL